MSTTATPLALESLRGQDRLEALFDELAELTGQRNAVDGRIVDIVADIDGNRLWGATGCRSISALVAWRTGISPHNAETITTIAKRAQHFPAAPPRCGRVGCHSIRSG